MKNYLDEIYTVSEFQRDHPALAEKAERALSYLKGYCPGSEDATFVIIEVEGYKCVAFLLEDSPPLYARRNDRAVRQRSHLSAARAGNTIRFQTLQLNRRKHL